MQRRQLFLIVPILLLLCSVLLADSPPTAPQLRIETAMHSARINRIAVDAGNRYLVSGSSDKTVRIWDMPSGRLLRTWRPPIGTNAFGRIVGVAITPDGLTVAAGGLTYGGEGAYNVYLIDRNSGATQQVITGLPASITNLYFSPDGQRLAVLLGSKNGMRIYKRAADGRFASEIGDRAYDADSYNADFSNNDQFVTTADDGYIRRYLITTKQFLKVKAPEGHEPWGVAFSPDGSKIAVGYLNAKDVDVLSARDLGKLFSPNIAGVGSNLNKVAWSFDGTFLYGAGNHAIETRRPAGGDALGNLLDNLGAGPGKENAPAAEIHQLIRRWADGGQGAYAELSTNAANTITSLSPLRDGGIAYASFDPTLGAFDAAGRPLFFHASPLADYRDIGSTLQVNADGSLIHFCYRPGGADRSQFSLVDRALIDDNSQGRTIDYNGIAAALGLTDWRNNYAPKLRGAPLPMSDRYENSRAFAPVPHEAGAFVLATDFKLYRYGADGKAAWATTVPAGALGVTIADNAQVAVAALADGTLRWYRLNDGSEIMALFPHPDHKRWVLWTPEGYYDTSVGGENLVGWHVNRDIAEGADFFPIARFRSTYYRPDVISRMLTARNLADALIDANKAAGRNEQAEAVAQLLPPVISVISPGDTNGVLANELTVRYSVRTPSGEPVTAVRVLIDGRPAGASRDLRIVHREQANDDVRSMKIAIPSRDCVLSLVAEDKNGAGEPVNVRLKWLGAQAANATQKPNLYILAVGVSKYADENLTLGFAAKDAGDFVNDMLKQKGGLYNDVQVKLLTDKDATRAGIEKGLAWIQAQTTNRDVAMVFLSGHGANDAEGNYFFVPQDFDRDKIETTSLPYTVIKNIIANIPGKALFFIDSCHAGNVMGKMHAKGLTDITSVVNELASAENGVVVFCASTGNQVSWENDDWHNGAFTKSLLEGVDGNADAAHSGRVTLNMLDLYISERVKQLTKGKQTPTTTKPDTVADFPVALHQ